MAVDVAPALLEDIQAAFDRLLEGNRTFQRIANRIRDGTATQADIHTYAQTLGEVLSAALQDALTEEALPDGILYFNIADRTIRPMLEQNHYLTNEAATQIQRLLDEKAGLGIQPVSGAMPADRIAGLVDKAASAPDYASMRRWLGEPIVNCSEHMADEFMVANAEARYSAGMRPRIVRTVAANCCDWCADIAGVYDYADVRGTGNDVFRRHEYCRCIVTYESGRERQDVWSKSRWQADSATLAARKIFNIDRR